MSKESSLLFSLRELRQIEDDRVSDERIAEVDRRRREEDARRAAAEQARRREEEARRLAAEETRRRDEELAARRRELELESQLRVAEAAVRQAELATEEAVRREVLARGDAAAAAGWPLGVKLLVALLALAVIGEGAWIWQRQGGRAVVAERSDDRRGVEHATDCPGVGSVAAQPAVAPTGGQGAGDGTGATVTPAKSERTGRTDGPGVEPGKGRKTGGGGGGGTGSGGGTGTDVRSDCVCEDPNDPLCCLD